MFRLNSTRRIVIGMLASFLSLPFVSAKAQVEQTSYNSAKPVVKSFTATDNGFKTTFTNVKWLDYAKKVSFQQILTREFFIKSDGNFDICNAQFKANMNGEMKLPMDANLNEYLTDPGWMGKGVSVANDGIIIDTKSIADLNSGQAYLDTCHVASPLMFLRNANGTYKVSFDVKNMSESEVKVYVRTSGVDLLNNNVGLQEVSVPADNQTHHFDLTFTNGTWKHRVVIGLMNHGKVELVKGIKISQDLKKGDRLYRSIYYSEFSKDDIIPNNENDCHTVYTHNTTNISRELLSVESAKAAGGYLGYRLLYRYDAYLFHAFNIVYSMFSDPFYLPGQTIPELNKQYVHLGYVANEEPISDYAQPASLGGVITFIGAIKIPISMSAKYKSKGGQVIGVRFATGAAAQPTQWFEPLTSNGANLPFAFVAKKMKGQENEGKTIFIQRKSEAFGDGWNEVYFDHPYQITDEDFYVGFCVQTANIGRWIYLSDNYIDPNSADSRLKGFSSDSYTDVEDINISGSYYSDQGFLIQAIVKLSENSATINVDRVSGENYYYNNKSLSFDANFVNTGNIPISSIEVKVGAENSPEMQTITFDSPLQPGNSITKKIILNTFPSSLGKAKIGVQVVKIGEKETSNPFISFQTTLINAADTFPRTILADFFSSEPCPNCPNADADFFKAFESLPKDIKDNTIFVFNHFGPMGNDVYTMKYSEKLVPFFGVAMKGGRPTATIANPNFMVNREKNPFINSGSANGFIGNIPALPNIASPIFNYARNISPAFASVALTTKLTKEGTIQVVAKGKLFATMESPRAQEPVYITLMMTQDSLPQVDQRGAYEGFFHNHVLRYVDEHGVQGQLVTPDNDGNFEITYNIDPELAQYNDIDDLRIKKARDNQFIMLGSDGSPITKEQTLKHINVIVFLHYYRALPTKYELTMENPEIYHNQILNAAQAHIEGKSSTQFAVKSVMNVQEDFHFEGAKLVYSVGCFSLKVYSIKGILMNPKGYFQRGVYVVDAVLNNGQRIVKKIICNSL